MAVSRTVGPQPVTPRWPPAGLIAEKFCGSKMPAGRSPRARITPEPASDGAEHDPPPGKVRLRSVERRGGRVAAYQPLRPGRQARSAPKAAPLPQPVKRARYLPGPRRRHHLRLRLRLRLRHRRRHRLRLRPRNMCLLPGPPMGRALVGRLAPDPAPPPPRAPALTGCRARAGGRTCSSGNGYAGCLALALSRCTGDCRRPASGISGGLTRAAATTAAISTCEGFAAGSSSSGTCRIATSDSGDAAVICGSAGR